MFVQQLFLDKKVSMRMFILIFSMLFATSVASTPIPLTQWTADVVQTTTGDFPNLKNGTESFKHYYDYPLRDRFSYPNGKEQVYRFDVVNPHTKFGKAFQWMTSDPKGTCCFVYLENLPPGEPPPGEPQKMSSIAVSAGSKDLGPFNGGEHFEHKMNIVVLKVTEDWVIDENRKNIILQYNQTVSSPLTKPVRNAFIQSDFANTIVGNLTKADFAYPGGCTRQCHALEKDFAFKHHHRMGKII